MKRLLVLCAVLSLAVALFAQPVFYYGDNGPVLLEEDRSRLTLHFFQPVNFGKNFLPFHESLRRLQISAEITDRVIVEFTSEQPDNPAELAAALGLDGPNLRSASFGLKLEDGFPLALTHRVLYQLTGDEASMDELLSMFDGVSKGKTYAGQTFLETDHIEDVLPLSAVLAESGLARYAHPDFMAKATLLNDPLYNLQFYLHNTGQSIVGFQGVTDMDIDAPEAWAISLGDSAVVVAVVDEGVEDHEDLNDPNGASRVLPGYTTSNPGVGTGQPLGQIREAHGQASAGIIAASHNSIGVKGVAPYSKILPVHIIIASTTPLSAFVDGITWAWKNGAWIMNNGWTYNSCVVSFPSVTAAIDSATQFGRSGLGTVVVFASGADGQNCVTYPGNLPNVVAVGACNAAGTGVNYANKGSDLDVVSPSSPSTIGADARAIVTVMDRMGDNGYNRSDNYLANNDYSNTNYTRWFGGTSVSCATVSGVCALVLSVNSGLTETQVRNILNTTAVDIGAPGFDNTFGHGIVNAEAALIAAQEALPIELTSLEARLNLGVVDINWVTATEVNSDYFEIQRSFDGAMFEKIGSKKAAGNSSTPLSYTFTDRQGRFGEQFYRLKMVDLDGSFAHSYVVRAFVPWQGGAGIAKLRYISGERTLHFELMEMARTQVRIQVSDLSGRVLFSLPYEVYSSAQPVSLAAHQLSRGVYLLSVQGQGVQQLVEKFVVH